MTVETPPSGTPGLAAGGHPLDRGAGDLLWVRVLSNLSAELRSCGLEARMDGTIGAVDAIAHGPAPRVQKAVLRPHRGRLWWWLHSGAEPALPPPHRTPLTPAEDTADAARRIVRVLGPARD